MSKIKPLSELIPIIQELKSQGKKVGLITGCFDIVHIGHVELFRFAKQRVDVIVVGLDNDESIRISKDSGRPIFSLNQRSVFLAEFECIDWIFPIENIFEFKTPEADLIHSEILKKLDPDFLITHPQADLYLKEKTEMAKMCGVKLLVCPKDLSRSSSSSLIISRLEKEF